MKYEYEIQYEICIFFWCSDVLFCVYILYDLCGRVVVRTVRSRMYGMKCNESFIKNWFPRPAAKCVNIKKTTRGTRKGNSGQDAAIGRVHEDAAAPRLD